jgi:hypothetical protein
MSGEPEGNWHPHTYNDWKREFKMTVLEVPISSFPYARWNTASNYCKCDDCYWQMYAQQMVSMHLNYLHVAMPGFPLARCLFVDCICDWSTRDLFTLYYHSAFPRVADSYYWERGVFSLPRIGVIRR